MSTFTDEMDLDALDELEASESAPATDAFIVRHLETWAAYAYFATQDERETFVAWTLLALMDDPSLADLGWPAMLNAFHDT